MRGDLHGCRVDNGALIVTHILFADDSYLFYRANLEEANNVMSLLTKFGTTSG